MNRIEKLFAQKESQVLSIYFTAGFPKLSDTTEIIYRLEAAGVDMIEIGFPFSDPLADGPVIQESSGKAIGNGMNLKLLFEQLKDLRKFTQIPIVLMGYMNPVLQFGEKAFIETCSKIGIDGIILPDLPLDYFETELRETCIQNQIANILLVTPETSENRIRYIDSISSGFLYVVSSNSITGKDNDLSLQTQYFKRIQDMNLKNPTLIGFGIRDGATFSNACKYSQGAIIGTAFIRHLAEKGTSQESISGFVNRIRG